MSHYKNDGVGNPLNINLMRPLDLIPKKSTIQKNPLDPMVPLDLY